MPGPGLVVLGLNTLRSALYLPKAVPLADSRGEDSVRGAGVGGSPEGIETGLGSRYRAAYLGRLLEEFEEIVMVS